MAFGNFGRNRKISTETGRGEQGLELASENDNELADQATDCSFVEVATGSFSGSG